MPHQFDIVENLNPDSRTQYPLLVILQHDRIASVGTVVVAPLIASHAVPSRLQPQVEVEGRKYVVFVNQLAAVPKSMIGRAVIGTTEGHRYELIAALDLLFTGV